MSEFPKDIYTEPRSIDFNTLENLGPLSKMAGIWEGERGLDIKPKAEGPKNRLMQSALNFSLSIRKRMARNYFTACDTTCMSPSQSKSRPITIKWVIGYGSPQRKRLFIP